MCHNIVPLPHLVLPTALLIVLVAVAPCRAQSQTVGDLVRVAVGMNERICNGILNWPNVSDEDKQQVRELLKETRDAGNQTITKFGEKSPASIAADRQMEKSRKDLGDFLQKRPDLYWISGQAEILQRFEPVMLASKPQIYLDLFKEIGVDETRLAKAKQLVDLLAADLAKAQADPAVQTRPADAAENYRRVLEFQTKKAARIAVTRDALRALLTPDEQARLDWRLPIVAQGTVIAGTTPPAPRPVRFSRQVAIDKAPQAGKYALTISARTREQQKVLFTAALKQGDLVGFRKTDKGVVAAAGNQETPLPDPNEIYLWTWEKEP